MPPPRPILYLGRSRLHRSRANLIQTLHMVHAFHTLGHPTRLYLPAWPREYDALAKLREVGVPTSLDMVPAPLLHPRFRFHPFIFAHRRELLDAAMVHTRAPELSAALSRWDIPHHLEVHDTAKLVADGLMGRLIASHLGGPLGWLFPITRADASRLIEAGADPRRVHIAPSGVDADAYRGVPPFEPAMLDRPRIVYLGRVTLDRGLAVLRHVAEHIDCSVTAVGDLEAERVEKHIQTVPFVPHREVPSWYARCDLALMPYQPGLGHAASISPIKLFEAMAAGRPILASRLPTIQEVIEHERTGLLVDPLDPDAWVAAVRRLRHDRDLAVRLATHARAEVGKYTWAARGRGMLEAVGLS